MAPTKRERGLATEMDRVVLSVASDAICGRKTRHSWSENQKKVMFAAAKLWSTRQEKNLSFDQCRKNVEEVEKAGIVVDCLESASEFNKPLLDDCALDKNAYPHFAWDLIKRSLTFLHPVDLSDLRARLTECPQTDNDPLASLFFGRDIPEWLKSAGSRIYDLVREDGRLAHDMSERLLRAEWRDGYVEVAEQRRRNVTLLNKELCTVMAFQFLCETLSSIPNLWPGFGTVTKYFREKGQEREELDRWGQVMDVEARTVRRVMLMSEEEDDRQVTVEYELASYVEPNTFYVPETAKDHMTFSLWLNRVHGEIESMKGKCHSAYEQVMACFKRAVGDDGVDSRGDFDAWYRQVLVPRGVGEL